jgi:RNA recognition motif-containing protein
MQQAGTIRKCEILRSVDGESKGGAVVEYMDADMAAKAIQKLTDTDINGRPIYVREDREREGFGRAISVRVDGIPSNTLWKDLKDHFSLAGQVVRANVYQSIEGQTYGIVLFNQVAEAEIAVKSLDQSTFLGRKIDVRVQSESERSEGSALFRKNKKNVDNEIGEKASPAKVLLSNLSHRIRWPTLKDHCKRIGRVTSADVFRNDKGEFFGVAYFDQKSAAARASTLLNNTTLDGKTVSARIMTKSDEKLIQRMEKMENTKPAGDDVEKPSQSIVVFVDNLSPDVTWQTLKDLAKTVGNVRYVDVFKNEAGEAYGVLKFPALSDAKRAVKSLQNTFMLGKPIRLCLMESQDFEAFRKSSSSKQQSEKSPAVSATNVSPIIGGPTSVYVGNLSVNVEWQDLKRHMEQAGEVHSAHIYKNQNGSFYGIVVYNTEFEVDRAIRELQNSDLLGHEICVLVNNIPQQQPADPSTKSSSSSI